MAFIKGIGVALLCGCLISLALGLGLALLVAIAEGGSFSDFLVSLVIGTVVVGVWVMPAALFFGLLYAVIRSAVRPQSNSETEPRV